MRPPDIWPLLGIDATGDTRAIRRAYAVQLKSIDIDADPEHYAALRAAREEALRLAADGAVAADPRDARWSDPADEAPPADAASEGERLAVHPFRAPSIETMAGAALTTRAIEAAQPLQFAGNTGLLVADDALPRRTVPATAASFRSPLVECTAAGTMAAFADQPQDDGVHYNAILAILFPNGERTEVMPTLEQEAELLAHLDAIIHGSRIGEMAYFADAERWFGDIIAHGAPASNCLMAPAAAFFRWRERAGELAEAETVAFINRRLKVFDFIEQVSRADHPWHRAWRELTTYAHERSRRGWGVKRQHVRELLEAVRSENPDVEGYFDGTRVALWENPADWANAIPWAYMVLPAIMLLGTLGRCADTEAERNQRIDTPVQSLSAPWIAGGVDQRSDIDRALRAIGYEKLNLALIESKNPELATMLKSNWSLARDSAGGLAEFPERLRTALNDRLRIVIRNAPYHILSVFKRNELERAELYRRKDLVYCDDLFTLGKMRELPGSEAIDRRQAALVEDMLLEVTDLKSSPPRSHPIPAEAFKRVVDRTGLSAARVQAALDGKADAADRCNARIALMDAVLALPPDQGIALLRIL